jgi:hypothetical protein
VAKDSLGANSICVQGGAPPFKSVADQLQAAGF